MTHNPKMYCRSGHNHRVNVNRKTIEEKTVRWPKNWQLFVSSQVPSNKTLRRPLRRQTLLTVINWQFITLGWVVRKKVNINPGLNINWSIMFYCLKMFFTSNVWCSLRLLYSSKLKGKQYEQNTISKTYKTEIQILANPGLVWSGFATRPWFAHMRKLSSAQAVLFEILEKALCRFTQHYKATTAQTHYVTDLWHGCIISPSHYFSFPKPEQYRDRMILLPLERRKCKWYSRRKWSSTFERVTVLNTQSIWRIKRHFWITSDANFVFVDLMFYSMQSHRWSCNLVI